MAGGNRLKDRRVEKGSSRHASHRIPLPHYRLKNITLSHTDVSMNQSYDTPLDYTSQQLDTWMNEEFPSTYPSYNPHIIHITTCVTPNGYEITDQITFDHLFYFEHHMVPSRSFFMIEYGIPLNKRVIEHILKQVQEIHTMFSNMSYEDKEAASQEYRDMIQQMSEDTDLTPDQCDLPFRIFFSHPVEPIIEQYLYAIHDGISSNEYESFSHTLCMNDDKCIPCIKYIDYAPQYPFSLSETYVRYHTMSFIHDSLKKHNCLHLVTDPLSMYLTPYEYVKDTLECSKGRIDTARLIHRCDGYPSDRFPRIEDVYL